MYHKDLYINLYFTFIVIPRCHLGEQVICTRILAVTKRNTERYISSNHKKPKCNGMNKEMRGLSVEGCRALK